MKNLFINAVSSQWKLILFDDNRQIIWEQEMAILLNESSKLIGEVDSFLTKFDTKFDDIKNIVVVHWPWSFTWIRTIVLLVNTLSFIYKDLYITPLTFFDMFENYPICKTSSKRDMFVKKSKSAIIEIIKNEDFNLDEDFVYGDIDLEDIKCIKEVDYISLIQKIELKQEKRISPLYIKKPNIT